MSQPAGRLARALVHLGLARPAGVSEQAPPRREVARSMAATAVGAAVVAFAGWWFGWVDGDSAIAVALLVTVLSLLSPYAARWGQRVRSRRRRE